MNKQTTDATTKYKPFNQALVKLDSIDGQVIVYDLIKHSWGVEALKFSDRTLVYIPWTNIKWVELQDGY